MVRITLIGPGAIGALVAARLCRNPDNEVTVAARTAVGKLTIESDETSLEAAPVILTDPGEAEPADWVLVATKAYDSPHAAEWFATTADDQTRVAVLQNGVTHVDRFSQWIPRERILPVIVDCPSERIGPGRIRQRGPALLTVPSGDHGTAFASLFVDTGIECRTTDDFVTAAWWKLCLNAAGVINALLLQPARIAQDELANRLMRHIINEAAAVGRAEGAKLAPDIADELIGIYRGHPPDSVNSLHADVEAGRPTEIDLRNGVVVELGKRHGIRTPYNDMAVTLLRLAEE
jgi:2-dehydropantoate 2-reductase